MTAFALVCAGCAGLTEQQRAWLAEGDRAYDAKQYDRAAASLTSFLNDAGDKPEAARALYVRSQAYVRMGRRPQAYSDVRQAIQLSKDSDLAWRAHVALGSLCFDDEDWAGAASAYSAAAASMPARGELAVVLYRLGQAYQRLGRWPAALQYFQRIVSDFPQSREAEAARIVLANRPTAFYIRSGVFGQERNAEAQAVHIQRGGFTVGMRPETRGSQSVTTVYVGPFNSYSQAKSELPRVRGYSPDAVIWP